MTLLVAAFISVSNLRGAKGAQGKLIIQSALRLRVDSGSNPLEQEVGYGYWNDEDKSLTLRVVDSQGVAEGQLFVFSFTIKNPWPLFDQNMICGQSASYCIGLELRMGTYVYSDAFGVVGGLNEAMNIKVRIPSLCPCWIDNYLAGIKVRSPERGWGADDDLSELGQGV